MKILLIAGASGSGKSTIVKELCKDERYNLVHSFTDRQKRDKYDIDHTFVDSNYMDLLLERNDIVAQTNIEQNRYCTIRSQFDEDKINVYIVDVNGMNDTIDSFPYADLMSILIRRKDIDIDCIREGRDVCVPIRNDVDFLIDNNTKIDSVVGTINTLVGFDLFNKPSHKVQSIQSKISYIDNQYRYLDEIKYSLYEQMWYQNRRTYLMLCKHVEEQINKDFDFKIIINPDEKPEIYDGALNFNVIAEYTDEDVTWIDTNNMVEKMSLYARTYCEENKCEDMLYNLTIAEQYVEDAYE